MQPVIALPAHVSERHLGTLRTLVQYAEVLAEHMNTIDTTEQPHLWRAIEDGYMSLKQLGGSTHLIVRARAAAEPPPVKSGPCTVTSNGTDYRPVDASALA